MNTEEKKIADNADEKVVKGEKEIEILQLIKDVWAKRKFIFKWCFIGAVIGVIVAFSIPAQYVSTARLAPEYNPASAQGMGSLGGLASMAGFGGGNLGGTDAISSDLYPDVVSSVPFITNLFSMEVASLDGEIDTTLYHYLKEEQKKAWWSHIISAPFQLLGYTISAIRGDSGEGDAEETLDIEKLTRDQFKVYKKLRSSIIVGIESKTNIINVSVKMQDSQIALDVNKAVVKNLQEYISNYRTQKIKHDLSYTQKMFDESKDKYYAAQHKYALFEDENKNISSSRYKTEQVRLKNDMSLSYSIYSTLAQKLEEIKLKAQEQTPVYTTVEPASRSTEKAEPNKPIILILYVMIAALLSLVWVVFKANY